MIEQEKICSSLISSLNTFRATTPFVLEYLNFFLLPTKFLSSIFKKQGGIFPLPNSSIYLKLRGFCAWQGTLRESANFSQRYYYLNLFTLEHWIYTDQVDQVYGQDGQDPQNHYHNNLDGHCWSLLVGAFTPGT